MIRALFAASALLVALPACAQERGDIVRQISVTGEGTVSAQPDLALLTFSVRSRADDAGAAFAETTRLANAVLEAVDGEGVAPRDRQTGSINLNPVYAQDERRGYDRSRIVGYEAYQSLTVRLRNIDTAGEVIDTAVRAGANGLEGFELTFDDPRELQDRARIAAVEDAMAKARAMAEAAGAELGDVISLSTNRGSGPQPVMMRQADMAVAESAPVIAAGEMDMRVTVNASFFLE